MASGDILFPLDVPGAIPLATASAWKGTTTTIGRPYLCFVKTGVTGIAWEGIMPMGFTSLTARIHWFGITSNTNNCVWRMTFQLDTLGSGTNAWGANNWYAAGQQTVTTAAPTTFGLDVAPAVESVMIFTAAQAASIIKGSPFRVLLERNTAGADTLAGSVAYVGGSLEIT